MCPVSLQSIFDPMLTLDFPDLLDRYGLGERQFQQVFLKFADGFECDLREVDLTDAVIDKAYLPYSNLSQAKLCGIVIKAGNLGDAKLLSADLSQARLNTVNLSRADLRYACLAKADLRGCNLSRADLQGANLQGADLTGADLTGANLSQAKLKQACFNGATLFRAAAVNLTLAACDRTTILPNGHYYQ